MTKTILIPVDFSSASRSAQRFAIDAFRGKGHRYLLLNAYGQDGTEPPPMISLNDILRVNSEKAMSRERDLFRKELNDAESEVEIRSTPEPLEKAIRTILRDEQILAVVMAADHRWREGRSDLPETLVHGMRTPVVLVPWR